MPQTFPESPEFPPGFEAEQCVWEALRAQLPEDAVLISGQRITGDEVRQNWISWCCGRVWATR